ncbi:similar to Saccharomyces cerevisiae YPR007C REC8 Meiosis-specific component of sister chromatid cohesion complex [Maudiozyma saulgeensis]|uniref:Similar to Saccharomyces cerevisiae YPR007C REC8 Meiosis-specific component of sister chromatid cohesion complex n=1 Tax=Maudiozyma saulgeensis TaxID=1789683 RepID=A0A1X7R0U4_9SACH|nr:similar to Saccharomyces cerevisiae YPR007C REC8 Meiosis-specific component of sister chromatid cohesion complex [Kazachstania saulgeensis]
MDLLLKEYSSNGVATVWSLATLGSSNGTRQGTYNSNKGIVKKKEILDVSIPDTCEAIKLNKDDFSLRHISSLLYGVTICYNRKTEYFLNDITTILSQLTRTVSQNWNIVNLRAQNDPKNFTLQTLAELIPTRRKQFFGAANTFLKDDKNFDIQEIPSFEDYMNSLLTSVTSNNNFESALIRRKDYISELNNSNYPGRGVFQDDIQLNRWDFNPTLEEMPIEMDFELDINDVVSQGGSSVITSNVGHSEIRNLDFESENNKITSSFLPLKLSESQRNDHFQPSSIDLELEQEHSDADATKIPVETLDNQEIPYQVPSKKQKISNGKSKNFTTSILIDSRTGLPTNVLRNAHDNYVILMQQKHAIGRNGGNKRKMLQWETLLFSKENIPLVEASWRRLFSADLFPEESGNPALIENGRRDATTSSLNHSNSGSIRSTEVGRRQGNLDFLTNHFQNVNEDSLLLNLDQINEDLLEDHLGDSSIVQSVPQSKNSEDYVNMNMHLLPSSVGRNLSRYSTSNNFNSDGPDIVDILNKPRDSESSVLVGISETSTTNDTEGFTNSEKSIAYHKRDIILSAQARKFYSFIKERALFQGVSSNLNPHFKKQISFEILVPSNVSMANEPTYKVVSKGVVAGAFFTLLTLASQEMIQIEVLEEKKDILEMINTGEDIRIYV